MKTYENYGTLNKLEIKAVTEAAHGKEDGRTGKFEFTKL